MENIKIRYDTNLSRRRAKHIRTTNQNYLISRCVLRGFYNEIADFKGCLRFLFQRYSACARNDYLDITFKGNMPKKEREVLADLADILNEELKKIRLT